MRNQSVQSIFDSQLAFERAGLSREVAAETAALTDPKGEALSARAKLAREQALSDAEMRRPRIDALKARGDLEQNMANEFIEAYLPKDPITGEMNKGTIRMRDLMGSSMSSNDYDISDYIAMARYQRDITEEQADLQTMFLTDPTSHASRSNVKGYNRTATSNYAWADDDGKVMPVPLPIITLSDGKGGSFRMQLRANQAQKAADDANLELHEWLDQELGPERWRRSKFFSSPFSGLTPPIEGIPGMPAGPGGRLPES